MSTNVQIISKYRNPDYFGDKSNPIYVYSSRPVVPPIIDTYTKTQLDAGQLDNRYYTETELDAGQLDNRYYTETESDNAFLHQSGDEDVGGVKTFNNNIRLYEGVSDQYITIGIQDDDGFLKIGNGSSDYFYISQTGEVSIGQAPYSGTIKFNVLGDTKLLTSSFSSGWAGSGSRYYNNGGRYSLELDDLYVRGEMNVYELVINRTRATNGSLIVSPGAVKLLTVTLISGSTYDVTIDTDSGNIVNQINDYDNIRCQKYNGRSIKYYTATVGSSTTSGFRLTITDGSGTPEIGDEVIVVGNGLDSSRQGFIYLTASDSNAPYMDVLDGVTSYNWSNKTKVRLGKLDGITDATLGTLSGYGLYSSNVYLSGKMVITSGGVSGFTAYSDYLHYTGSNKNIYLRNSVATSGKYGRGLTIYDSAASYTSGDIAVIGVGQIRPYTSGGSSIDFTAVEDYGLEVIQSTGPGYFTHLLRLGKSNNYIAGWNISPGYIYSGTKKTGNGYSAGAGSLTLNADGSIHAPSFYVNADGTTGFKTATGTSYLEITGETLTYYKYSTNYIKLLLDAGRSAAAVQVYDMTSDYYTNYFGGSIYYGSLSGGQTEILYWTNALLEITQNVKIKNKLLYQAEVINLSSYTITDNSSYNISDKTVYIFNYAGSGTIYLPASPTAYRVITIINSTTSYACTIQGNGKTIYDAAGSYSSITLGNRRSISLIYNGTTWSTFAYR